MGGHLSYELMAREPLELGFQDTVSLLTNPNILENLTGGCWPPCPSPPAPCAHRAWCLGPGLGRQGQERGTHTPGWGSSEASPGASSKLSVSVALSPPRGDDQDRGGHSVVGCLLASPGIAMVTWVRPRAIPQR